MSNQFRDSSELKEAINKLLNEYGMEKVLEELTENIRLLRIYNEEYIEVLYSSLDTALRDYRNRYG